MTPTANKILYIVGVVVILLVLVISTYGRHLNESDNVAHQGEIREDIKEILDQNRRIEETLKESRKERDEKVQKAVHNPDVLERDLDEYFKRVGLR